jgi:enterobacterial common antigen flippase
LSNSPKSSYGQIFKSTAFTGGASVISILLGIVRTKVMAVLLGPSGVGMMGLYTTITGLASTLSNMGLGSSGVRQIAEAAGSGDKKRISRTIKALRRAALVAGALGAIILAAASYPASVLTFGDGGHTLSLIILGLAVFLGAVTVGQTALIQGMRRIADLARLNILGSLAGTVIGIPVIWFWREQGIVPLLLVLPAASLYFSWWIARRVPVSPVRLTARETFLEARVLLGLGFAFMATNLMTAGVAYLTRVLIVRKLDIEAAGYYAAAYTLAGIYAGFILQAMGTDFYPRLTQVAEDHSTLNRLVNEQTEIALMMAVPGILGTLTLAPWVIRLLYSGHFEPAVTVLQWQMLGILGQVITWPMGFILPAKGRGKLFLLVEILANAIHVALVWSLVFRFGISGAGMAFAGLYLFHSALVLFVSRRLTGFRWSSINLQLLTCSLPLVGGVFLMMRLLPPVWSLAVGLIATLVVGGVCLKGLLRRMPAHRLGRFRFIARWAGNP